MTDVFPGAKLMQISQWGFPRETRRPAPNSSLAYSVIHITGNPNSSAEGEALYRINNRTVLVGATFFINSNGSIVQCYSDPLYMDPWTNGVLNQPDLTNPRIAAVKAAGVNPNERSLITIELCGYEPTRPITAVQEQSAANLIRYYHARIGMPVNRQTVVGHYQFDRVNRPNCPSTNKTVIDRIVALAQGASQDDMTTIQRIYPSKRTWYTKAGTLVGYRFSPEPLTKAGSFNAGSPAHSDSEFTITPTPAGWPAGPYQRVIDGSMAGYLVANTAVTLGPEPMPVDAAALEKKGADGAAAAATAYADSLP